MKLSMYPSLTRSVAVSDVALDGNTLEALLVPWDVAVDVADITVDGVDRYREGFRRTAFDMQMAEAPSTMRGVVLMPRHESSETFGHMREAKATDKGFHAVMSLLPSRRDDVAGMVADGIDSVSIEFNPLQRETRADNEGVRWRTSAFLTAVAMTPTPAYADAKVLAMRAADELAKIDADRAEAMAALEAELDTLRNGADQYR